MRGTSICIYCGAHPVYVLDDPKEHDRQCKKNPLVYALEHIRQIAIDGRDWDKGHFCPSRSKMQSIVDKCNKVLKERT